MTSHKKRKLFTPDRPRLPLFHPVALVLFFLPGVSALIYEVAWERQLVVVFGNTMLSTATVLAAFMAGLTIGNYVFGKYADKKPEYLLRTYALLEAGIGLHAVIFLCLSGYLTPFYVYVFNLSGNNLAALNLVRFAVSFLVISTPTFLMGGTLPILSKLVTERCSTLGRSMSFLYSINTAGGMTGSLLCGFLLLKSLGITNTIFLAIAGNLTAAALAFLIWRKPKRQKKTIENKSLSIDTNQGTPGNYTAFVIRLTAVAIFLSGFSALACQVLWSRILNIVLGSSIYSFTTILSSVLAGIAIGSMLYSVFLSHKSAQTWIFGAIQAALGIAVYLAPYTLFISPESTKHADMVSIIARSASLIIVPTILMGMALPCAVQICRRGENSEGASVGNICAINTIGAAIGSFMTGFVLIPLIGLQKSLLTAGSLNFIAGIIVVLAAAGIPRFRKIAYGIASGAIIIACFLLIPPHLFKGLFKERKNEVEVSFYKEGVIANVVVLDFNHLGYRDFFLNGTEEASTRLWHVQLFRLLAALPVTVHEGESKDAIMIAFGAGMSAGSCANIVDELECVELNPDIRELAEYFKRENFDAIHNPCLKITINDGRNQLLLSNRQYDLILSDATNPTSYDAWTLYTKEFYELCRNRLKQDGVFCQWIPSYLPDDGIKVVLNTFRKVFPTASLWGIHGSTQWLMLATPEKLKLDYRKLKSKLLPILEKSGLDKCGIDSVEKFLSCFIMGEEGMDRLFADYDKYNTDNLPLIQFMRNFGIQGYIETISFLKYQENVSRYLTNMGDDAEEVKRRLNHYYTISQMMNLGYFMKDNQKYRQARMLASQTGLGNDANILNRLGCDNMRERHLKEHIARNPEDVKAILQLGFLYHEKDDHKQAIRIAQHVLTIKPDAAEAHNLLGLCYLKTRQPDKATAEFLQLKEMNPTYRVLTMLPEALKIASFQRILKYHSGDSQLKLNLAQMYMKFGWGRKSLNLALSALEDAPNDINILSYLANVYEIIGMPDKCLKIYTRISGLIPFNKKLSARINELKEVVDGGNRQQWNVSRLPTEFKKKPYQEKNDFEEAIAVWNDISSDSSITGSQLGLVAENFDRILASGNPENANTYKVAATLYDLCEKYEKALYCWKKYHDTLPDAGKEAKDQVKNLIRQCELKIKLRNTKKNQKEAILLELADSYFSNQEPERAIKVYKEILAANPMQNSARTKLGTCYIITGRYEKAIAEIRKSLKSETDPEASAKTKAQLQWLEHKTEATGQ